MREVTVHFENYNEETLEKGLGIKVSEISDDQLSKILSFALGYIDYESEGIANELRGMVNEPFLDKPFYELYKEGKVIFEYVHYEIDKWNNSKSDKPLHEFLGLTEEQYARFVDNEDSIKL